MITCQNCSTSNPEGAKICTACGAPLVESADMPTGASTPQADNKIPEPSPYAEPDQMQTPPADESPDVETTVPAVPPYRLPEPPASGIKKDRSLAIILEVVPGLVGFLGIGWIYSGYTNIGIAWLLGFLVWNIVALAICILTAGVGCLCTLPINLVVLIASVVMLNSQIQKHSEQFNP